MKSIFFKTFITTLQINGMVSLSADVHKVGIRVLEPSCVFSIELPMVCALGIALAFAFNWEESMNNLLEIQNEVGIGCWGLTCCGVFLVK